MGDLKQPEDRRAAALFSQLEARYFQFCRELPPSLELLASRFNTYSGDPEPQPFETLSTLNPVLAATPWLFWETFQQLEQDTFLQIAEAGMYFVLASVLLDHLVDQQADQPQTFTLLHQALYQRGISGYQQSMADNSPFWVEFERLGKLHIKGLAAELEIQPARAPLPLDILLTMAHGKVAPIVTTSAALAAASGQPQVLAPIEASLNAIAIASQLLDDIGDWRVDLEAHHLTYFLSQCIPPENGETLSWPTAEAVQAQIEAEWLDTTEMHRVIRWLDRSIDAVANLDCPAWVDYVNGYRERADQHLTRFYLVHLGRVFKPG